MQELCRANDIIFVADEVITGFGRAGAMFASERFGLRPDVMIMAKGMTSGYLPMGATVVGERVWEPFWKDGSDLVFRHGLTYSGHATVCAAAHANLDIIEREGLVDRVRRLETVLHDAVQPLAAHPLVKEVRSGDRPAGRRRAERLRDRPACVRADHRARRADAADHRPEPAHLAARSCWTRTTSR